MAKLELQKIYQKAGTFCLKDIHFVLETNTVTAVIGRSGAGKSTLIRLIAQAEIPEVGRILYDGKEMYEDEYAIRKKMSVVYDVPNFNTELKAGKLAGMLQKMEPWFDLGQFSEYMEFAGLDADIRMKQYSTGMQKKFMLILALCRQPELLIMDEPTSAVDPVSRKEMIALLHKYRREHELTVLFSTHNFEDVEEVADYVILLKKGQMVYKRTREAMLKGLADREQIWKELGE